MEAKELTALIIDDEDAIATLLTRLLIKNGVSKMDVVRTTQEGLDLLTDRTYNLAFIDLNQRPSGIEVYQTAIAKGSYAYIMSGYASDMQEAQSIATNHFIMKPFTLPLIDGIIKECILHQQPQS